MSSKLNALLIVLVLAAIVVRMSIFAVDQRDHVLKLQFREIVAAGYEPGLHFKWPLIDDIVRMPKRVLNHEMSEERFLTGEKKNLIVDYFVTWRITDPAQYYTAVRGNEDDAWVRLSAIIKEGIKAAISRRTVREVVSADRSELMDDMLAEAGRRLPELGVEVVDVRVKRIELSDEVTESVYLRMRQERQRVATQLRAEGDEESARIEADAERQQSVILADAYREAEQIRGEGDARATEIYAQAYGKDPQFYQFYRSMLAYRESIGGQGDILVLKPDSEFFKFLQNDLGVTPVASE